MMWWLWIPEYPNKPFSRFQLNCQTKDSSLSAPWQCKTSQCAKCQHGFRRLQVGSTAHPALSRDTSPPDFDTFTKLEEPLNIIQFWRCGVTYRYSIVLMDHVHSLTYLLTPWGRVLLEKLTGFVASQEIPRIFWTRRFITVLTSARHLSLSWANSIQSSQPPPTSWRSI